MHVDPVAAAVCASPRDVGRILLALPEDQWFDRKSVTTSPEKLATLLVGMANADGGTVVLDLSEGRVQGTDRQPARRNTHLQAAADFTEPPVRVRHRLVPCRTDDGAADHLLLLEIEPGGVVHATHRDEVFLRVGDETRKLSFIQRQELVYDKGQSTYETSIVVDMGSRDLAGALVQEYAAAVDHPDGWRLLESRGLTRRGGVTVAGCLLFALEPQARFPNAHLHVLRWRGGRAGTGSRQQLLRDVRLEGPLTRQIAAARDVLREIQPTRRALLPSGRFGPVGLIPEDAWLEGVVNAVVHRSYSAIVDHVRVGVFDDRIEIESPGRFPGIVRLDDPLRVTRFARNPRIARMRADLGFGQEFGEGIWRMFEEMRAAGLGDPAYRQTSGSVVLTLWTEPADQALDAQLPDETRTIVTALRGAGRLSTGEIAQLAGLSRPMAVARLKALHRLGLIEWVGTSARDPRAYWRLPGG